MNPSLYPSYSMNDSIPAEYLSSVSQSTPLFRTEVDAALSPLLVPWDQYTSSSKPATLPNYLPPPPLHLTGSDSASAGDFSHRSAQTYPNPSSCFEWGSIPTRGMNNVQSDRPVSSPIHDLSESSAHGTQRALGCDVVVIGAHPVLAYEREQEVPYVSSCTTSVPTMMPANLYPEHVVAWYLMCWNAVVINGPRKFVPQSIYQPQSQGDRERYVSLARLNPPIVFLLQDSLEWGVPIQRLLSKQVTLVEGNKPAFSSCGPSIGVRMHWPGYQPCHKQVSTKDFTAKRRMINKSRLAKIVARCVKQFMDTMSEQAMQVGSDRQWKVGPHDITANDIILVSLHHVSQGSWQPQLRLRRTIGADIAVGPQSRHGS